MSSPPSVVQYQSYWWFPIVIFGQALRASPYATCKLLVVHSSTCEFTQQVFVFFEPSTYFRRDEPRSHVVKRPSAFTQGRYAPPLFALRGRLVFRTAKGRITEDEGGPRGGGIIA